MLCGLLGHRYRFAAEGNLMTWRCQRGCGAAGSRAYPTAQEARRFAAAFAAPGDIPATLLTGHRGQVAEAFKEAF
jgi:hypothetical protein